MMDDRVAKMKIGRSRMSVEGNLFNRGGRERRHPSPGRALGFMLLSAASMISFAQPAEQRPFPVPDAREAGNGGMGQTANVFEVAVVRPAKQDNSRPFGIYIYPGGRVVALQVTVRRLIAKALNLRGGQIRGTVPWFDTDLWDVTGLPPDRSLPGIAIRIRL